MTMSTLIEEALEERGNAIVVVAHPLDGEQARMATVNASFARVTGRPMDFLTGSPLRVIRDLVQDPADWTVMMNALGGLTPLNLDLKLRVNDRESWFGFGLTFKTDARDNARYGIVIGRDITEARRRGILENETQRMLASVFLRVATPVLIVRANGKIFMANPAFQRLLGYDAAECVGLGVEVLTPPESAEAARVARARQLLDGSPYQMRMEIVTKAGIRLPVTLHSAVLSDSRGERLRVVTLLAAPGSTPAAADQGPSRVNPVPAEDSSVGQIEVISLDALKASFGEGWQRIQSRATMMAEQIVKRRLAAGDVFSRGADDSFVLWFDSTDKERNAARLLRITRDIRLQFLTEFGEGMAAHVSSVIVNVPATDPRLLDPAATPSPALLSRLRDQRQSQVRDAALQLQALQQAAVADVSPVTDRDGKTRPVAMVDFEHSVRHQIVAFATSLSQDPDRGANLDLLRLDLAIRELDDQPGNRSVLVPLTWSTLTVPDHRRSLDARLSSLDGRARQRLMLAIAGTPPLPSGKRWSDVTGPLRRQLSEVGVMLALADGDSMAGHEAMITEWPLSLLVIDATSDGSMPAADYFSLIATARRRDIQVLVRLSVAEDRQDWRELGATMFVAAA